MSTRISRRHVLGGLAAALGSNALGASPAAVRAASTPVLRKDPFRYCLNAALVMGYKLDVLQ